MVDRRAVDYVGTRAQFGMGKIIVPLVRLPNDFWISKNLPLRGEIGTNSETMKLHTLNFHLCIVQEE